MTRIANFTRRHPRAVDMIRRMLPLSMKRKISSMLLPSKPQGETRANDGRRFITIPDRVFVQVVYDGIFEPSLSNFMLAHIEPQDCCVDIGANFGWFTTLMATKCDKVIAYEPATRIYDILLKNIDLNDLGDKIDVRKKAVGNESGEISFVIEGDEARESALGYVATDKNETADRATETVDIVRLDEDLAAETDKIALMKIDGEGFEHFAVQGAIKLLSGSNPPIIITEANRGTLGRSGSTREALCAELESHGYRLFGMKSDGSLYEDDGAAPALAGVPSKGRYAKRFPSL